MPFSLCGYSNAKIVYSGFKFAELEMSELNL
jgi:hypothetical protein